MKDWLLSFNTSPTYIASYLKAIALSLAAFFALLGLGWLISRINSANLALIDSIPTYAVIAVFCTSFLLCSRIAFLEEKLKQS